MPVMLLSSARCRPFAWSLPVLVALAALAPASAPAAAGLGPKGGGPLTPPLEVLASPVVAERSPAAQADRVGIPRGGPGSLVRDGRRVLVTARFSQSVLASLGELREAGGEIVDSSPPLQTATVSVAPEDLRELAAVPGVRAIWPVREPFTRTPAGQCEGGAVISEGLAQLQVDDARGAFELRGRGLTVGVLSDSFDAAPGAATRAAVDVESGDLPGPAGTCSDQQLPVNVLQEGPPDGGDEGRAMLQIVHDLAPHAALAFATAFITEESFAQNIERLARPVAAGGAGAQVLVDDVGYFDEPFFQDGPVAVAIDNVTDAGASYFSAAGNDNLIDAIGRDISSWEAPAFRDSLTCPPAILALSGFNGTHCMDFDPGAGPLEVDPTFGITVKPKEVLTIDLQWAEPWYGVGTDIDAFLLSEAGLIEAASFDDNPGPEGTQRPVEILQWENESSSPATAQLAINRFAGGSPRLKFILLQNGGGVSAIEYPESAGGDVVGPSIFGHAGSASATTVAAVPFNDSSRIEPYSSRGPVTHRFGPVVGTTPAAALGAPEVIAKPDLAATDCGATTFFAVFTGVRWRFCGTSAAAPHAAAAAALVRQAKPTLSQQQVRATLTGTAAPVGAFPAEAAGAGLLDAFTAVASLPKPIEGGDGPSVQVPPPAARGGVTVPASPGAPAPVAPAPTVPATRILKHPRKVVRTRGRSARAVFRFGADRAGATFLCKLDRGAFRGCRSRIARRFGLGRHAVRVRAVSAGLADPTPAVFRFRVEQVR